MFKYLDAKELENFFDKFEDEVIKRSGLNADELSELSKNELNELLGVIFDNVVITKDNIHLYYEFMSDEDFNKYGAYLRILFTSRYTLIRKHFQKIGLLVDNGDGYDFDILHYEGDIFEYDCPFGDTSIKSKSYKGISFFGVKDTLKPIEEYIAEIKESEQYKEYIISTLDEGDILDNLEAMGYYGHCDDEDERLDALSLEDLREYYLEKIITMDEEDENEW